MQIAQSHKPFSTVDYYNLGNGFVDVFLHKNETRETDKEDNVIYKAEEIYFRAENSITKEYIEENFDLMWGNNEKETAQVPTVEERLQQAEDVILNMLMGGV